MDDLAEMQTREARPRTSAAPRYRIHLPQGRELVPLPTTYETLEEAKQAFEVINDVARWCLIGVDQPGRNPGLFGREAPSFVVQGRVDGERVTWKPLASAPAPEPPRPKPAEFARRDHMTAVLTPELGFFTAEEVVRHVCTQFQIENSATAEQLTTLQEFLRRGLLAYVGPEAALDLASRCVRAG